MMRLRSPFLRRRRFWLLSRMRFMTDFRMDACKLPAAPGPAGSGAEDLALLALNDFVVELDALAVVRLGRALIADLGGELADQFLVRPRHGDETLLDGERDALRRSEHHRIGVADVELQVL